MGDETTRRTSPRGREWAQSQPHPLGSAGERWGALNVVTGQLVRLVRERCRTADTHAFVEHLGRVRPKIPKRVVWDNAPPHHPKGVRQAAEQAHIQMAFLPFRAPELMPCEDL